MFWDLHNGADADGDFDPTVYGWQGQPAITGSVAGSEHSVIHLVYAEKMIQYFARPGDSVLDGTSDNLLLPLTPFIAPTAR